MYVFTTKDFRTATSPLVRSTAQPLIYCHKVSSGDISFFSTFNQIIKAKIHFLFNHFQAFLGSDDGN